MSYLDIFGLEFENKIVLFKSVASKFFNERKNDNVQIWDQKWLIWVFLGWDLKMQLA